jgi:hypothetical protein
MSDNNGWTGKTDTNSERTSEEILARLKEIEGSDFFGFQRSDLIDYLPFNEARPFLKEGVTADQWAQVMKSRDAESIKARMLEYMPFAWDKANNCRGLSAARSVEHMKAWLWLLNDPLGDRLDDLYQHYGKPCLRAICENYGWYWRQWDDGKWRNDEDEPGLSAEETEHDQ